MESLLDITSELPDDTSIEKFEFRNHVPINTTNLNTVNSRNEIVISDDSVPRIPALSNIIVRGKIVKKSDGSDFAATDDIKLIKNGVCFIFDRLWFMLSDKTIAENNNVGIVSTLMGSLKYTNAESKSLEYFGWMNPVDKGKFALKIPLKHLLGCFQFNPKVIIGRMALNWNRNSDDDAIVRVSTVDEAKIEISEITWEVPQLTLSLSKQREILKIMDSRMDLPLQFQSWNYECHRDMPSTKHFTWRLKSLSSKCRFIIIGLQTARERDQTKIPNKFDHCNIKNAEVIINTVRYPYENLKIDMSGNDALSLFSMYKTYRKAYYNSEEVHYSYVDFVSHSPIIVLDVSRQPELLNSNIADVTIELEFEANVPANTHCHLIAIIDKFFKYNSSKVMEIY